MTNSRLSVIIMLFLLGMTLCTANKQESGIDNFQSDQLGDEENQRLKEKLVRIDQEMSKVQQIKANKQLTQEEKLIYDMKLHIQDQIMSRSEAFQVKQNNPKFSSFLAVERQWLATDDPKKFFLENGFSTSIHSIPTAGASSKVGWSGSYWPMRNGGISVRYPKNSRNTIGQIDPATGNYLSFYNWSTSVSKYAQPAEHRAYSGSSSYARYVEANYSPAEKYDLLIGDYDFTLTNFAKSEGAKWAFNGDVIGWFGICHGWSPASTYYPEPRAPVYVTAVNGMTLKFFPDDVKALASQFWANAKYTTLFAGSRCPFYPSQPGFLSSGECRSLNPGTLLLVLGNHVGLRGKSITLDPSSDPEIWNHPIKDYKIRYFNPITNDFFTSAAGAKSSIGSIRRATDSYLRYVARVSAPGTMSVVGFMIKITFTKLTPIDKLVHGDTTAPTEFDTKEYVGFIDLDRNDNIIGGEWKHTAYPQYLWYYDEFKSLESLGDNFLPMFRGSAFGLNDLAKNAKATSAQGQVFKSITDYLAYTSAGYTFTYR
jgi:hypothetical protein